MGFDCLRLQNHYVAGVVKYSDFPSHPIGWKSVGSEINDTRSVLIEVCIDTKRNGRKKDKMCDLMTKRQTICTQISVSITQSILVVTLVE